MTSFILFCFLCGSFMLVFSQSPFYSLLGVLVVALAHSFVLAILGSPFYSALIIIIYAGGMLVVFLFSTILSAARHLSFPNTFFAPSVLGVFLLLTPFLGDVFVLASSDCEGMRSGWSNLTEVYSSGGFILCVVGCALLVCLVGVLLIGFEQGRKQLRRL
uniref:NADH dehydrogenase subunit 6 n=1 Tax=Ophiothrix exigua TaxID=1815227 RepID=UPI00286AF7E3|nr:NADH dehydrogenase subunit 6 [Ophiothrix exigua]WKW95564.1 NADH dehydrogenase subunit 6 [Ophiothrix exigua]